MNDEQYLAAFGGGTVPQVGGKYRLAPAGGESAYLAKMPPKVALGQVVDDPLLEVM